MKEQHIQYYRFDSILQREGWMTPAYIGIDLGGTIKYLSTTPPDQGIAFESVLGFALPGFQNAHSHAFQYGMAGLAENHPSGVDDDFWSWREAMYQCALSMNPDQAEAVATMLYTEMLSHGYTHVAEFHYLHHDQKGSPYAHVAEMGERMIAAAKTAGIRITLVPVFYQKGGFGQPPQPRQKRFISASLDDYLFLLQASEAVVNLHHHASLGISVHSLRAVDLEDVKKTVELTSKNLPFHIHVAEQLKEVNDCLSFCGARPMQWMLENLHLDSRFHLVHSTHLDDRELSGLVATGAHVVLCPSTEGNLGDGIFRMKAFAQAGGQWSIGTDSHIGINPLEELRMIDYRQRLITHKRNTFDGDGASYLVQQAFKGGQAAMGLHKKNNFEIGQPLDAVVYSSQNPLLETTSPPHRLATLVYHAASEQPLGTLVNGKWVVKNGMHIHGQEIQASFKKAMKSLALR